MTPQQFISFPANHRRDAGATLNVCNQRSTWLELAHLELDRAVLAAYGWPEEWAEKLQPSRDPAGKINPILGVSDPATEQEMLARLLALNLDYAKELPLAVPLAKVEECGS